MEKYFSIIKEWTSSPKGIIITSSTIAFIVLTKYFFRGGVCRVDRLIRDEVIVITGGNTGIGK